MAGGFPIEKGTPVAGDRTRSAGGQFWGFWRLRVLRICMDPAIAFTSNWESQYVVVVVTMGLRLILVKKIRKPSNTIVLNPQSWSFAPRLLIS